MDSYKVTQARRKRGKLGTRGKAPEGAERKRKTREKENEKNKNSKSKDSKRNPFFY